MILNKVCWHRLELVWQVLPTGWFLLSPIQDCSPWLPPRFVFPLWTLTTTTQGQAQVQLRHLNRSRLGFLIHQLDAPEICNYKKVVNMPRDHHRERSSSRSHRPRHRSRSHNSPSMRQVSSDGRTLPVPNTYSEKRGDRGRNGNGNGKMSQYIKPAGESGRSGFHPIHFSKISFRSTSRASLLCNFLWPFVPAAIAVRCTSQII